MSAAARQQASRHSARLRWYGPIAWMLVLTAFLVAVFNLPTVAYGYTAKVHRWTPAFKAAAAHYQLSGADTKWIVAKGLHVIDGESGGSAGAMNGGHYGCVGLLQFAHAWKHSAGMGMAPGHHHTDWRLCGTCSCWRFVRVFKIGGKAAIRRHWAATYN